MNCLNCGSMLEEDSRSCKNCGAPTGEIMQVVPQSNVDQRKKIRSDECEELDRMIRHFSKKSAEYARYDQLCELIDPRHVKKKVGLLVWGIILCTIAAMFFSCGTSFDAPSLGLLAFGLLFVCGGLIMIIGFIVNSKNKNANYRNTCREFDALTEKLYRHYLDYGPCLVSAEYTNPSNLRAIRDTVSSGRADTIKEAVNILVEDAYRNNMSAMARQTAIAADAAARGARAAAVFSAARFFIR